MLLALIGLGAVTTLTTPLALANKRQIDAVWTALLTEPWYFVVDDQEIIAETGNDDPQFNRDVYDNISITYGGFKREVQHPSS